VSQCTLLHCWGEMYQEPLFLPPLYLWVVIASNCECSNMVATPSFHPMMYGQIDGTVTDTTFRVMFGSVTAKGMFNQNLSCTLVKSIHWSSKTGKCIYLLDSDKWAY
jgi:hypothetical protein